MIDRVDSGARLEEMAYYNLMVMLDRFMPEVRMAANLMLDSGLTISEGPPEIELLLGWDAEECEEVDGGVE